MGKPWLVMSLRARRSSNAEEDNTSMRSRAIKRTSVPPPRNVNVSWYHPRVLVASLTCHHWNTKSYCEAPEIAADTSSLYTRLPHLL